MANINQTRSEIRHELNLIENEIEFLENLKQTKEIIESIRMLNEKRDNLLSKQRKL